ncbi:MAG: hypothetical protein KBD04_02105 [Proteobacteria bacterium]|nr:hypothetical protein [Pseudomonadota bacterium]
MNKKLLFSLLLGSSFSWINEMHATAEDSASIEGQSPALAATDSAISEENKEHSSEEKSEKKYKAINLDGNEIEVQFFDKSMHPGMITKKLKFQDGGIYDPTGKQNFPYMAGEKMPEGAAIVYVLRKNDNKDEIKLVPANANIGNFPGYSGDPKEWWMYKDENNYLYPYTEEPDPNASLILGKQASVYVYEVPDLEATEKEKALQKAKEELAELQEKLKSGAYAVAAEPGQSVNTDLPAATNSEGLLTKKFQFGDGIFEGKQMNLVCTTSDPKATQETFLKLVSKLLELFSTLPNVAVAMFSLALDDENSNNLRQIRISGEGISVNLMFSSEIDPQTARRYVEHLRSTTFSPDEMKSLQEKHNLAVKEYEAAMESMRLMQAQLDAAKELAAQALTTADEQKLEKAKADLEAENAKAILDATQNELILEKAAREQSEEEKLAAEEEAKQAAILAQKAEQEKLAAEEEAKQAAILAQKAEEEKLEAEKRLDKAHNAIIQVATAKTKDDNAMLSPTLLNAPAGDLASQSNGLADDGTNVEQQQTLPLDNSAGDEVTKPVANSLADDGTNMEQQQTLPLDNSAGDEVTKPVANGLADDGTNMEQQQTLPLDNSSGDEVTKPVANGLADDGTNMEQQQTLPLDNSAGDEVINNGENLAPNPQTSVVDESTLKASVTSPLQQSLAPYLSKQTEAAGAA